MKKTLNEEKKRILQIMKHLNEDFSSMDLPLVPSEEIFKSGKIFHNKEKDRWEFLTNIKKDENGNEFRYRFYIEIHKDIKYLHFEKIGEGIYPPESFSTPIDKIPDWVLKHYGKEIEGLKVYYVDENSDDKSYDDDIENDLENYRPSNYPGDDFNEPPERPDDWKSLRPYGPR